VVDALIDGGFRADAIAEPGRINVAIERARRLQFVTDCRAPRMCADDWGDDKGYADFAILAFWLFGFRIESFYYLYFLVLGISAALFAAEFRRQPACLLLLPLFLAAHHVTVVILPDSVVTAVLHDARFLPALSMVATLHLALVASAPGALGLGSLALATAQVAVIILAIDGRASTIWQVVLIVGAAMVGILRACRAGGAWARTAAGKGVVLALIVGGVAALAGYKRITYDERYLREGIPSHVVWHNVYMGLGIHPQAVSRFDLNPTDATSYRHATRFLRAHPEAGASLGIEAERIRYPVFSDVGWRKYDQIVRATYWQFWRDHPRYAAESYVIYKPKYLLEQLLWQAGVLPTYPRWVAVDDVVLPTWRHLFNPFHPLVALAVMAAIVIAGRAPTPSAESLILCAALFFAALIPAFVVAPLYYDLGPIFVALALACYASVAFAVSITAAILR
jgi:hypothetical protein